MWWRHGVEQNKTETTMLENKVSSEATLMNSLEISMEFVERYAKKTTWSLSWRLQNYNPTRNFIRLTSTLIRWKLITMENVANFEALHFTVIEITFFRIHSVSARLIIARNYYIVWLILSLSAALNLIILLGTVRNTCSNIFSSSLWIRLSFTWFVQYMKYFVFSYDSNAI